MTFRGEGGFREEIHAQIEGKREEYLTLLSKAKTLAEQYRGTDNEYHHFFSVLQQIEAITTESPQAVGITAKQKEESVAAQWQSTDAPITIERLIDTSRTARDEFLRNALQAPSVEGENTLQDLHIRFLDAIILPSGEGQVRGSQGESEWHGREYEERLLPLIQLLEANRVYTDDTEIVVGKVDKEMVRSLSYVVVRIPRIHRMVLVCNLIQEATFVVKGHLRDTILANEDKDSLQKRFPDHVRRIVHQNEEQWARDIQTYLFSDDWEAGEEVKPIEKRGTLKVSIVEQENIREQLLVFCGHSPEKWLALGYGDLRALNIQGRKIESLLSVFGVKGKVKPDKNVLALQAMYLGLEIFGLDKQILQAIEVAERTPDMWKERIEKEFSVKQLLNMTGPQRDSIVIDGYKLTGLAKRVAPEKKIVPMNGPEQFLAFLLQVYGQTPETEDEAMRIRQEKNQDDLTLEDFIDEIKKQYPTEEDWNTMDTTAQSKLMIFGKKYHALFTRFGVVPVGKVIRNEENHRAFGQKIYHS